MSDKAWKQFERRAAALLGGIRNAYSGANPHMTETAADVKHPYLFCECKYRARHSVVKLWDTVHDKALKESKIPILALAEHGRPGCWLLVYSGDLQRLSCAGATCDLPMFKENNRDRDF